MSVSTLKVNPTPDSGRNIKLGNFRSSVNLIVMARSTHSAASPSHSPPPLPSPPAAPPPVASLDIDLDFIPFDIPSTSADAGPSTAGPSTLPKPPHGLPSRPLTGIGYSSPAPSHTPIHQSIESSKKQGKKRSIEQVDYGHHHLQSTINDPVDSSSEQELDFDGDLDIDPHEVKLMRRLRATGIPWMSGFDWKNVKGPSDM
jgi:hypothetical protein